MSFETVNIGVMDFKKIHLRVYIYVFQGNKAGAWLEIIGGGGGKTLCVEIRSLFTAFFYGLILYLMYK